MLLLLFIEAGGVQGDAIILAPNEEASLDVETCMLNSFSLGEIRSRSIVKPIWPLPVPKAVLTWAVVISGRQPIIFAAPNPCITC